jgi:hypothetical protein
VLSKNRKDNTMFGELIGQLYGQAVVALKEYRFICEYHDSELTGQYYPSFTLVQKWMQN